MESFGLQASGFFFVFFFFFFGGGFGGGGGVKGLGFVLFSLIFVDKGLVALGLIHTPGNASATPKNFCTHKRLQTLKT